MFELEKEVSAGDKSLSQLEKAASGVENDNDLSQWWILLPQAR
jgi:hypothetical protein